MTEPTPHDLVQDGRLSDLESLITAEYEPPQGVEYSYPIANQGITQAQFRNMMRGLGKGTLTQHTKETAQSSYRLVAHPTTAETNQRNTLLLKPAPTFDQAETASNGFFHVLTETMEIPFPAVTSTTKYHVGVTYDPRLFSTTPLKIEVYPGEPPTSHGRDHVVLFTVTRTANQLLTQAPIQRVNHWLGNVINSWSYDELPDPTHVEYGTLAVCLIPSSDRVISPELYSSRGVHGWIAVQDEKDYTVSLSNEWEHYAEFGSLKITVGRNRAYLSGTVRKGLFLSGRRIAYFGAGATPEQTRIIPALTANGVMAYIKVTPEGQLIVGDTFGGTGSNWLSFEGANYRLNN